MRVRERKQPSGGTHWGAVRPVGRANIENDRPLAKQLSVRLEKSSVRVVNAGRLRRHAVQFHDGEIAPSLERLDVRVSNVEAADEESGIRASDLVDALLERGREEMAAIAEQRALTMVTGEGQGKLFARIEHTIQRGAVARRECRPLEPESRMRPDERFDGRDAITDQHGKMFVGDREDATARRPGQAIVGPTEVKM